MHSKNEVADAPANAQRREMPVCIGHTGTGLIEEVGLPVVEGWTYEGA